MQQKNYKAYKLLLDFYKDNMLPLPDKYAHFYNAIFIQQNFEITKVLIENFECNPDNYAAFLPLLKNKTTQNKSLAYNVLNDYDELCKQNKGKKSDSKFCESFVKLFIANGASKKESINPVSQIAMLAITHDMQSLVKMLFTTTTVENIWGFYETPALPYCKEYMMTAINHGHHNIIKILAECEGFEIQPILNTIPMYRINEIKRLIL